MTYTAANEQFPLFALIALILIVFDCIFSNRKIGFVKIQSVPQILPRESDVAKIIGREFGHLRIVRVIDKIAADSGCG